jgi:hypothetical protein
MRDVVAWEMIRRVHRCYVMRRTHGSRRRVLPAGTCMQQTKHVQYMYIVLSIMSHCCVLICVLPFGHGCVGDRLSL